MSNGEKVKQIILVSDGTGETLVQLMKAAIVQFSNLSISFARYKNVRSKNQLQAIFELAETNGDLVVYTIVSPELRANIPDLAKKHSVQCVDVMGPLILGMAKHFSMEPMMQAGILHNVNDEYFKRIEGMEYTIAHDDGKDLTGLDQADLVILGISRTSKTPLSMYLSHHGWRIANIPMVLGVPIPKEVMEVNPKKVIALTIDTEALAKIRRARLSRLGQKEGGDYADLENVDKEIEYANEIFRKNRKWAMFDVTGKALEETASEIIKLMASRKLIPPHVTQFMGSSTLSSEPSDAKTLKK